MAGLHLHFVELQVLCLLLPNWDHDYLLVAHFEGSPIEDADLLTVYWVK